VRYGFIRTYITIGATLGFIIAIPEWERALSRGFPANGPEAKPVVLALVLATGHGVLRMYSWLPSLIYYVAVHNVMFEHWLFVGW
jgi:hypothetical protein